MQDEALDAGNIHGDALRDRPATRLGKTTVSGANAVGDAVCGYGDAPVDEPIGGVGIGGSDKRPPPPGREGCSGCVFDDAPLHPKMKALGARLSLPLQAHSVSLPDGAEVDSH